MFCRSKGNVHINIYLLLMTVEHILSITVKFAFNSNECVFEITPPEADILYQE